MVTWNNLDKLASFEELKKVERVNLAEVMSGENGAERVKSYSVPMAEGLAYNYAAKQVNEDVLAMHPWISRHSPDSKIRWLRPEVLLDLCSRPCS